MNKIFTLLRSELKGQLPGQLKGRLLRGRLRAMVLATVALLFFAGGPAWATDYVFMYDGGYLAVDNSGAIIYTTTFSPQCVWTCASNTNANPTASSLDNNNNRYLYTTDGNGTKRWLVGSASDGASPTTNTNGTGAGNWRNNDNRLYWRGGTYYLYYRGSSWRVTSTRGRNNNNTSYQGSYSYDIWGYPDYRSTTYICTTTSQGPTDNTTAPTISVASFSGNTITFSHSDLTGTFVPQYTRYEFNSGTHNYYNGTDYGSTVPSVNANTLSPNYAWSLTANGGGVATIDGTTGVLTLSGAPTGNITVRLTVSNISPMNNKTVDFTLTRASVGEDANTVATLSVPTISPTTASLEYNEAQDFTASATASSTTTTIPAHFTFTGGGNTYYCYNGTLYASTDDFKRTSSSPLAVSYAWGTPTGDAAGFLTRTPANNATTTVTHSTQATADATATLTVTASATGASSQTATVTILAYGPVAAPTVSRTGNSVSLATASADAIIKYTTDGSTTPSTDAGTEYTGPFDLTTSPTTVKAIAIRNGHESSVTTETLQMKLPTPVISLSGAVATVTAGAGTPAGTTLHYTTDGSTPTSSSSSITSGNTVTLTNTQTIKVIAIKSGYTNSDIASADYIVEGVSSGLVVLDDREEHSWSYYSDATLPEMMRSLNPADVKITYYGDGIVMTGNADYTASSTDTIHPGNSNYVGGAKVNVGGENENTFIYFKTLERGDATDAAWTFSSGNQSSAASRCPYTTIPNPFQVRPTYGERDVDANNFTGWRGFQCWRLKSVSGGAVYSAASGGTALTTGAVINGETEIYFAPNSEYGMEVELEAVWARAYLIKGNQSGDNAILSQNVGVERNFMTLTAGTNFQYNGTNGSRRITNVGYPVTISCYYPSGEAPNNTSSSVGGTSNQDLTLGADVKFENVGFYSLASYTLTANGHNLIVGRGCSGTVKNLYGLNAASTTSFKMRIESGTYTNLYFLGQSQNFTNDAVLTATMGCDYDRAMVKGGNATYNEKLHVSDDIGLGKSSTAGNSNNKGAEIFHCTVKSGNYDLGTDKYAGSEQFYISVWGSDPRTYGKRTLIIEGGIFSDVAGGMEEGTATQNVLMVDIRVKGGTMNSVVYGAAQRSGALGHRRMIFTGGLIKGWIAGGANGNSNASNSTGEMTGNTYIYVGGNIEVNSNNSNSVLNRAVGGNVFGAGCGYGSNYSSGLVTGNTNVAIADNAIIERGVYGGGSYGYTTQTSNIYILGGTINGVDGGVNGTTYLSTIDGGVYGGACQNQGGTVNILMNGGTVNGSVYGGSNYTGTLSGSSTVTLNGGTINGSLYGGGNGEGSATNVNGAVQVTVNGGTVTGAVYGCGNVSGAPQSTVKVDIYGTDPAPSADTYALGAVFGGGNKANYSRTPEVTVHNCNNSIEYVYGGGNAASVAATNVTIYGGNKIGNVFGGGNGTVAAANVTGNTLTKIYGGTILRVFGGSNSQGTIGGTITVNAESQTESGTNPITGVAFEGCALHVSSLYGGGNMANSAAGSISIGCMNAGDMIDTVYGGANKANISGDISLLMSGGRVGNLFGGNNTSGTVSGGINVTVNWATGNEACSNNYLGNVFGGGNLAPYTGSPAVSILNGTVSGNVYGGGKGTLVDGVNRGVDGKVTGNPTVTIGDNVNTHTAIVLGDVYGGGDAADVAGTPVIVVNDCNTELGYLYGGGNAADVNGTNITFNGGTVHHDAFGGGHGDKDASNPSKYADVNGNVLFNVKGGTIGRVFAGSNSKGDITGTATLNINKDGSCAMHIDEVYGGGNEAEGNAGTVTISCTGGADEGIGDVYGGANKANINSDITLNITGGKIDRVFGGNNTSGTISGNITVNVNWSGACTNYLGYVYGGGNQAAYAAPSGGGARANNPMVNILRGTVTHNVLGGGLGATAIVTGNPKVTVGDITAGHEAYVAEVGENVYGGGEEANVIGNTAVLLQQSHTVINGKVFGAGKGKSTGVGDTAVAKVTISSTVQMTDGWVKNSIYGGGEMASVGVIHYATSAEASAYNSAHTGANMEEGDVYSIAEETGISRVTVSGGTVGPSTFDPTDINAGGNVFGGGLGKAGIKSEGTYWSNFAYVDTTNVQINGTAVVKGSVFGGGENGHVKRNTCVDVSGGTVGVRLPYHLRAISSDKGVSNPVYAGNVYGGGRGVDHTAVGDHLSQTAGRVYGNTKVNISGTAHVYHSVYGGGSLASVGTYTLSEAAYVFGGHLHNFTAGTGDATVTVSGGVIGPNWVDLLYDEADNLLTTSLDGNADTITDADYALLLGEAGNVSDTIAKNYSVLGENEGMVYGSGRGVNFPNDENADHRLYVEIAFTNNTHVTISGTADVRGSVFGGGENGHVKNTSQVDITGNCIIGGIPLHHKTFYLPNHIGEHGLIHDNYSGDYDELAFNNTGIGKSVFRGNVYGGGRGIDHSSGRPQSSSAHIYSVSAGRVYGNTIVNITGGKVLHNVFGGGSIASVGTYTYPNLQPGDPGYDAEHPAPNFFTNPQAVVGKTGHTTVNITGGRVGVMGENEGYVYGGGRGIAGTTESQVSHLAFVNATAVTIGQTNSTHADVRASVFGGGMNGHVLDSTYVTVSGGVVGGKTADEYGSYDTEKFPLSGDNGKPASADTTLHGISYYSGIHGGDTITNTDGTGPATVFLGNVYGGGRGVDTVSGSNLSLTAGRVYGNTRLEITGGMIYHSVFGGGSIASVGKYTLYTEADSIADAQKSDAVGHYRIKPNQPKALVSGGTATVIITGGRIGTNGRNNGRVFGSSRGMAGTAYKGLGYVNIAHVVIGANDVRTTPIIKGSVFGSGENGHVLDSTLVEIKGGHIGNGKRTGASAWLNHYIGNVYGGGRGLDRAVGDATTVSPFAGRVYRSANVVVTGGQIDHNVYGGGSLASVGRFRRNSSNIITYTDADSGYARVTVSGGQIGIDGDENGHVFGASRGTAANTGDIKANLAYVARAYVYIQPNARIMGSVFGGGESGHVQEGAHVFVTGGEIGSTIPNDYNSYTPAEKAKYDLMGNVYGGGRGLDTIVANGNIGYSMSAGYVRDHTLVKISGTPIIHRNVYGGGSMGTVGDYGPYCRLDFWQDDPANFQRATKAGQYHNSSNGAATVVIKGTVGTSADVGNHYGGNVYGSSRGQANNSADYASHKDFYDAGGFGEMAYVVGSHVVVDTNALIYGNVYGGGENGHVDFAGTLVEILNGHIHGNVFGGGKGTNTSPTAGIIDGPTTVNIGSPAQTAVIKDADDVDGDGNTTEDDPYGSHNTVVIGGCVFGGNDSYSSPLGLMSVNIYHTRHNATNVFPTLPSPVTTHADTLAVEAALAETDGTDNLYALKGVYGGGNLANVLTGVADTDAYDHIESNVFDNLYITERINQTADGIPAAYTTNGWPGGISRKAIVHIYGCQENTVKYVYGGGKAAHSLEAEVIIDGGRIYQVYAGGDGSAPGTRADIGRKLNSGGVMSLTGVEHHGHATLTLKGGLVNQAFGGSNTSGEVRVKSNVIFDFDNECTFYNQEVFGGSNLAESNNDVVFTIPCGVELNEFYGGSNMAPINGNVTLNVLGGKLKRVYGGSKNANINGNVTLNVFGGTIGAVYGGNNVGGNITGTITVNIDSLDANTCGDPWNIDTVYGGGNEAAYTPTNSATISPMVNLIKGTVNVAVFGGGYGGGATATSNPQVIIGAPRVQTLSAGNVVPLAPAVKNLYVRVGTGKSSSMGSLMGDVFGGGFGAPVVGNTKVILQGNNTMVWHNVYGGGNAAPVTGNTDVEIGKE